MGVDNVGVWVANVSGKARALTSVIVTVLVPALAGYVVGAPSASPSHAPP